MTAGALESSARVDQCEGLGQAVCAEPSPHAFLTGKEWVAAVHALDLCSVGLQFLAQPDVDENSAGVSALGHVQIEAAGAWKSYEEFLGWLGNSDPSS